MSKVVLITGANTGIGFQIVRSLCSASISYHILVGARSLTKAHDAIRTAKDEFPSTGSILAPLLIDIESDESIQDAYKEVSALGKVDVLINNAGK